MLVLFAPLFFSGDNRRRQVPRNHESLLRYVSIFGAWAYERTDHSYFYKGSTPFVAVDTWNGIPPNICAAYFPRPGEAPRRMPRILDQQARDIIIEQHLHITHTEKAHHSLFVYFISFYHTVFTLNARAIRSMDAFAICFDHVIRVSIASTNILFRCAFFLAWGNNTAYRRIYVCIHNAAFVFSLKFATAGMYRSA